MKKAKEIISQNNYDINTLRDIMSILRSENGCPWDREQTHSSIKRDFIEETYEAIDAIDQNDPTHLREELGDVLLQVVFHSQIEEEAGNFTFDDVVHDICAKLIYRHPHVFGDVNADNSDEVLKNWELLKKEEKKEERKTVTDDIRAVPKSLPSLIRAQKIGKKAGKVGFDFKDASEAMEKVFEEAYEVRDELSSTNERIFEEIGDLLLSITNVARFTGVDCESALHSACEKFNDRFEDVENAVLGAHKDIKNMSEFELLSLWNDAKIKKR
ncbi:MAG: nucleoside triphosphate pyrophosphohydrolase [Ruminococcaceae bacterium]|nr:nucleoside triphosphate pyrophosphohydrolase [Oscillospiraceae bacterium]